MKIIEVFTGNWGITDAHGLLIKSGFSNHASALRWLETEGRQASVNEIERQTNN